MAARFRFSLITPNEVKFEGEVEIVIAPGAAGDLGVLANHAPLLTTLRAGVVTAGSSNPAAADRARFAIDRGFLQAMADKTVILTDIALAPEQASAEDARADLRRAEDALAQKRGQDDGQERAAVAWARARLELTARPV